MSTPRTPVSDKALWQRIAPEPKVAAVSDNELAAWLEGRLSPEDAARVDAAIVSDASLRAATLELAEILGKPLPAPPPRIAVRAQALVGGNTAAGGGRGWRSLSWMSGLLPAFDAGFSVQRGAMAGIAIVVAAVGFMMGGGLGKSFVERKYASAQVTTTSSTSPLGTDTSQQLNDLFTDNI